ncbi:MAG: hypothetical protein H8E05_00140 [Bacteroidetes bacterium]|nr:hypothetical protein [Bacteroidota bacterium]
MIKDNYYYNKHKVIYDKELQKLDNEIIKAIFEDPNSDESMLLNDRVEKILDNSSDN